MNKFKQIWSNLQSNFWFRPLLIVLFSIALAIGLIKVDSAGSDLWLAQWSLMFGAGPEGARTMMSTIAGSMMTVVGVMFSMILVVLALASSQYTSRILNNFIRNRITQVVFGIFAGIFTYCLIVLRTIRGGEIGFVPGMAVFFGFALALGGIGALMFFIHHIASSIQASSIISSVAQETIAAVDRLFPEKLGEDSNKDEDEQSHLIRNNWHAIAAWESGYIQYMNNEALLRLAREQKTIVMMKYGIGEFVVQNTTLASLAMKQPPNDETIAALQASFIINSHRKVEQDVNFGIRQIVDVALKALSPGVIDTTTAVMCVDYLTTILARIAPRQIPTSHHYEKGTLRMITKDPNFESLLAESFDQIRFSAKGDVAIISRMLYAFKTLAELTSSPLRRQALHEQVQLIAEQAKRTLESPHDSEKINVLLEQVREALNADPVVCADERK
ncbi:MAG TPA: DUF2254 domain-containing protein [Candidatus Saccharimonadales bacterium]|nr:DUF2254 domain-containing protein [Candidatus Saccharimonadales bacterium]